MSERQFQRILGYVYSNKYEYQIRFDKMQVVGTEWDGKVEVVTTPAGHILRCRANAQFDDLLPAQKRVLLTGAYNNAIKQGRKLMEEAEKLVYAQFLMDIKPIVMGVRDNPEFFTIDRSDVELPGGTLKSPSQAGDAPYRTIPLDRAFNPSHEFHRRRELERRWLRSDAGAQWTRSLIGKKYLRYMRPDTRPRGAPGAKKRVQPFELLAPYTPMDENPLRRRNWQAFLDNKHVAEVLWTRSRIAEQQKVQRHLQRTGQAWHSAVDTSAESRW